MIENSLFSRTLQTVETKRERLLNGKINCIPFGLPRFENQLPGIERGKYYLITANSKIGKTQITDWLFLFNTISQIVDNNLNVKLKVFYFTLEMSKEEKMLSAFANILYVKEGLRISPADLKSTKADKMLSQEIIDIIKKYEVYFNKIEEIVTFIDDIRNPTGINKLVRNYALANGTLYTKVINIKGVETEIDDYYEPDDPEEYVMIIIDHIGLIDTESINGRQLTLAESMVFLSSNYLIKLRNKFGYIPVVVQQQAAAQESVENKKANRLKPTLDGLGDSKLIGRDANIILGLFSPFRHEIPDYMGYDIVKFKDKIRFLEIIGGREGGAGTICPLYFDGATNYFSELPRPNEKEAINSVYKFIEKINV